MRTVPLTRNSLLTGGAMFLLDGWFWEKILGMTLVIAMSAGRALSAPLAEGMTQHTLANGLTVVLMEDHWHPIAALEVCYRIGSRSDPYGKQGLAHLLEHLTFPSPAFRHEGDATSLKQIVREDVSRFHRQAYRPEETVLAAAGNLTLEEIAALVKKDFGNWPAAEKTEEASPALSIRKKPVVLVIDRPLVQASVYLTFVGTPAASPDTPALSLLSHLLADSAESRLGQKLREQKGWTYGVRSGVKAWRQTGLFSLAMSVPYEVVLPALEETIREIVRVQTTLIPEEELERAKQEFPARFYFETENVRDISHFLAVHEAFTQRQEPPDHALAALQRVTAEEVQKVARRYLDPQKAEVTVMGDTRAISQYAPALVQGKLPQWRPTDSGKEEER